MILYHGSSVAVKDPLLRPTLRPLDFGTGLYVTSDLPEAVRWARLTAKRRGTDSSFVTSYELAQEQLSSLRVLCFAGPDREWLEVVVKNRLDTGSLELPYDVVAGPVADEQTISVVLLYLDGIIDATTAVSRLLTYRVTSQYAFKTTAALQLLQLKEVLEV
ncbi:MAG: DUF3990 domain-containing protein [Succinivibrio sp.]|nr:DUF3990 domain-containing protein [Succinivibrio sp.]